MEHRIQLILRSIFIALLVNTCSTILAQPLLSPSVVDSLNALLQDSRTSDSVQIRIHIQLAKHEKAGGHEAAALQHFEISEQTGLRSNKIGMVLGLYNTWLRLNPDEETTTMILGKVNSLLHYIPELAESGVNNIVNICIHLEFSAHYKEALELLYLTETYVWKRPNPYNLLVSIEMARGQLFSTMNDRENTLLHATLLRDYAARTGDQRQIELAEYIVISNLIGIDMFDEAIKTASSRLENAGNLTEDERIELADCLQEALQKTGQYAAAVPYIRQYLASTPELLDSLYYLTNLTYCTFKSGNQKEAFQIIAHLDNLFQRIDTVSYLTSFLEYYFVKGKIMWELGRFKEAVYYLSACIRSDKFQFNNIDNYRSALHMTIHAFQQTGQHAKAIEIQENLVQNLEEEIKSQARVEGQRMQMKLIESQQKADFNLLTQKNTLQSVILMVITAGLLLASFLGLALRKKSRQLKAEMQKSELLLLNMLPPAIAERMKKGEHSIADYFDEATVVFIDMVGFTHLSSRMEPQALLNILNTVFSKLDRLTARYGMEKIKTIGDCYMAVSGIPVPRKDHLLKAVEFSLAAMHEINDRTIEGHTIQFKIGMDTGPTIAGIIGEKRFLFDLWGNTVNTASRMESNGIPGNINVTNLVYEQLKDRFNFESRGMIDIKGKGLSAVYMLKPNNANIHD